jgi:hypothetical protein
VMEKMLAVPRSGNILFFLWKFIAHPEASFSFVHGKSVTPGPSIARG